VSSVSKKLEVGDMADGDSLKLGSEGNTENHRTSITKEQGFFPVLDLYNDNGVALLAIGGAALGPAGEAVSAQSPGVAVYGSGGDTGVQGFGEAVGVDGITRGSGIGVRGTSVAGSGVVGNSDSGPGVEARSAGGPGLYATSTGEDGVHASSEQSNGVYGASSTASGLFGYGRRNATGVVGVSENGWSGVFGGPFIVAGDFTVVFGSKSAAVPHQDGSYRRMYSVESPESWFEDFGTAELLAGEAKVDIDPAFAALIHDHPWHVFLTPEGDSKGLYVSSKSITGFEVREQQGGKSSLRFSYRIVGRRKDIPGERLQKVSLPPRPSPQPLPRLATKPEVPRPHDPRYFEGEDRTQ
jgi:hypothetical protein